MLNSLKVKVFRWVYRLMNRKAWKGVDLSAVVARDYAVAGNIPAREYFGGEERLIVYYHGGGWTIGDLETHDPFCRRLALDAHATVIAIDYRLGPEHPFPAAVDDCVAATRWVLEQRDTLPGTGPVFVAGDSAGGNLAAIVSNVLAPEQPGAIRGQLLIYPAVRHCTPPTASMVGNARGHVLTYSMMKWFWLNYLGDARQTEDGDIDPRATPLLHPLPEQLPPALVITAGLDPLRDEGAEYAQKLSAHGVDCVHELFVSEEHGFVCSEGPTEGQVQSMELMCGWMDANR